MKSKVIYTLLLLLLGLGVHQKSSAQFFGLEDNGNGTWTLWMEGGSITTNTQGQYSATNGQGTYCMGCYAQVIEGWITPQYNSVAWQGYTLVSAPPTNYYSTRIVGNSEHFFDENGNLIASIQLGPSQGTEYGVIGYREGCNTCAQQDARDEAEYEFDDWAQQKYDAMNTALQVSTVAAMQTQMVESYNTGNTYNYYYWYYAIGQLTGTPTNNPLPPPPPKPPVQTPPFVPEVPTDNVKKLPALYQGNRTYVAPNGVPFILPANAQVAAFYIDFDDFPNGAVYIFYIDGVKYVADETFWTRSKAIGEPQFNGYFQADENGYPDRTKPYIPTEQPVINTNNNTTLTVVRLRSEFTPNGCNLIQELVTYIVYPTAPTTLPANASTSYYHNTDIEYAPVLPPPPNVGAVKCPGTSTVPNLPTIDTWSVGNPEGGISKVSAFLNTHVKNSVKIYVRDCATGTVKYTVTKGEYKTLTPAEQATETANHNNVFNSNNFSGNSQDIAISGCISNGKWQYDAKINPASIANPHPKAVGNVTAILAEIKTQLDDELKKLKNPNSRSASETITVDGETFRKSDMNFLEVISTFYDLGKDIINDGKLPERIWDSGKRANGAIDQNKALEHSKSPFAIPATLNGGLDEIIEQITGIVQLVKTGYEILRHPIKSANTIWHSIKNLSWEKIGQMIYSASGAQNMVDGGDRAKYQGGRYAVMAATIFVSSIKTTTQGLQLVRSAGDEIGNVQKFVPNGSSNSAAAAALKNATDNQKLARVIDEDKMITKNIDPVTGQERFIAIDKKGDVYDTRSLNNMDEINPDVKLKADAGDLAEAAEDVVIHNEMKLQPQRFKDGKDFERNVTNDPTHTAKVEAFTGLDLSQYVKVQQVRVQMADGKVIVADNVWYKQTGPNTFDVVINETKLSNAAPLSTNQGIFKTQINNGTTNFTLNTSKFATDPVPIPKNAALNVRAFVKTEGNGTTGITNYQVKLP